ncbi:MAG: 16S rRNA (cytosine(1402)-N(4))-methyltransferase RsmH [Firmicutes bacterium]|nr:16S rRNA (cytosine(1402)-N(4))-methyltransferase RsmH [Bacillota bacterium]
MTFTHVSVMPEQVLAHWVTDPSGLYLDATLGGGGHSHLLLSQFPNCRLIAIDQDPAALSQAHDRLGAWSSRVSIRRGNFRSLDEILSPNEKGTIQGILFDLGVSSPQLDQTARGFGYQNEDSPLDMRMDPDNPVTAFRLVNMKPKEDITRALKEWGEERWASRIADFIVSAREEEPIRTTGQLVDLIKAAIPASARRTGGHPARRTFQALRIWVNDELEALKQGLAVAIDVAAPEGHIVAISFQSLEDRIVKHTFREWQTNQRGIVVTRRPLIPSPAEIDSNPRSHSAKMRVFAKS